MCYNILIIKQREMIQMGLSILLFLVAAAMYIVDANGLLMIAPFIIWATAGVGGVLLIIKIIASIWARNQMNKMQKSFFGRRYF